MTAIRALLGLDARGYHGLVGMLDQEPPVVGAVTGNVTHPRKLQVWRGNQRAAVCERGERELPDRARL